MCPNITCNNRTAWTLNIEQSRFNDWQKVSQGRISFAFFLAQTACQVRIQENASEIPTGSMPRSLDVVLRGSSVERAKAGDKSVFTGTFIVVPDVSQLGLPGVNAQMMREGRGNAGVAAPGLTGLKNLGVRDLQYKTAFLACMVQNADTRVRIIEQFKFLSKFTQTHQANVRGDVDEDEDQDAFIKSLTQQEIEELRAMVETDNIYQKLVGSIAPTVYGQPAGRHSPMSG